MLAEKRTVYDFLSKIVQDCLEPIGKTELYYKIKTAHDVFERWLNTTIRFKLVELVGNNKYRATQKGKDFLIVWAKLQTFLTAEELT